MTKVERAVATGLFRTRPEEPRGMLADVPTLVYAWANWNRVVDSVATEIERAKPGVFDIPAFLEICGADRIVPFDYLEARRR